MASSRSYSALASALLIGTLTLTGCGSNTEKEQNAAATASASAAQANLEGIQTLADNYATAMTTPIDTEAVLGQLTDDEKNQLMNATGNVKDNDNAGGIESFITALSPEAKNSLRKLVDLNSSNIHDLFDYNNLNDDQKLALDFLNFTLQTSTAQTAGEPNLSNNVIATDKLTLNGNHVDIPVNVLAKHELADETEHEFFSQIPAVYTDGQWKIDGQKYLQKYNDVSDTE